MARLRRKELVFLEFTEQAFIRQLEGGDDAVAENLARTAARVQRPIRRLEARPDTITVFGDQCRHGLRHLHSGRPLRKTTWWLVTCPEMAEELGVRRQCREKHDVVFGGSDVTTAAGQYTPQLARAILRGLRRTLERKDPSRLRRLCYAVRAGLWSVESTRLYIEFMEADSPEDEEVEIYDGFVLEADRTPTPKEGIKFNIPSGIRKLVTEAVLSAFRRLHVNMGHPTNQDLKRCLWHAGCSERATCSALPARGWRGRG